MLTQAQVHRAATTAVKDRYGWHVALEHRSGALGWTIDYATPSRFVTVTIPVGADSTEADARRLIEQRLPA